MTAGIRIERDVPVGHSTVDRLVLVFGVLAIVARVTFWIVTNRVWEDALITVTHARNAVNGLGLTHHPGDPLTYGFTSAISVLIPLAGEAISPGSGIFVLRGASLVAALVAIAFAARICRRLGLGAWPTALVLAYLAFDQNQVFYGMSGMETEVAVAILLWSVHAVVASGVLQTGASLGVSLLARPDFLLWVAAAGLDLGRRDLRRAVRILGLATFIIFPWILFTTVYYGSPIPNTILAKSAEFVVGLPPLPDPAGVPNWLATLAASHLKALSLTFAPFYEDTMVVSAPMPLGMALFVSMLVWVLAAFGAWRTWRVPGWRAAVLFAVAFAAYRMALLPAAYFDWYVPPHTAILVILAAAGIEAMKPAARFDPRPILVAAIAIAFAVHTPFSLGLERKIQNDVESAVRTKVGEALGRDVPPGDSVAAEPAGYFEYYSNVRMLDYPGLTSVGARNAAAELPSDHHTIVDFVNVVHADWLALRPAEWNLLQSEYPSTAERYELVDSFSSPVGSVFVDDEGRPRISFDGYTKEAANSQFLLLRKVR